MRIDLALPRSTAFALIDGKPDFELLRTVKTKLGMLPHFNMLLLRGGTDPASKILGLTCRLGSPQTSN